MGEHYKTAKIIETLKKLNGMVYLAAKELGCETHTIYNRAKKVQAVQDAIDNSRGELVDIAEQKLKGAVLSGEAWSIALVVKTLGKHRGYVEQLQHAGPGGEPISITIMPAKEKTNGEH